MKYHDIIEALQEMNRNIQIDVFQRLHGHGIHFTENNNGVFFQLTDAPEHVWKELEQIVQKEVMVERETTERENCMRALQKSLQKAPFNEQHGEDSATTEPSSARKRAGVSSGPRTILSMLRSGGGGS
jgi:hypothetical protein